MSTKVSEKHYKAKDYELITLKSGESLHAIVFRGENIKTTRVPEEVHKLIAGAKEVECISEDNINRYTDMKLEKLQKRFEKSDAKQIRKVAIQADSIMNNNLINDTINEILKVANDKPIALKDIIYGDITETIRYGNDGTIRNRLFNIGCININIRTNKDKTTYMVTYKIGSKYRKEELVSFATSTLEKIFGKFEWRKVFETDKTVDEVRDGIFKLFEQQ